MRSKRTPPRRRNAAATRAAILESAHRAFVQAGYDGAGVREIARGAGVTAMLVNRYFGSKEQLFAEVIAGSMEKPVILAPERLHSSTRAIDMAAALIGITGTRETPLDGFLIMLRSASSPRAAEIARREIEQHHHKTLTVTLRGETAAQRAALVLALVAGFQVMRQMIGLSALSKAEPGVLLGILAPLFRQLLKDDLDRAANPKRSVKTERRRPGGKTHSKFKSS